MTMRLPSSSPMDPPTCVGCRHVTGWTWWSACAATDRRMQIGILGATGPAGSGLAARLASVGFDVVIGSRSQLPGDGDPRHPPRAVGRAAASSSTRPTTTARPTADLVVIATPWDAAAPTAAVGAPTSSQGKVVISHGQRPRPGRQRVPAAGAAPRLGGGQRAGGRARAPRSRPAFHHVPAKELGDLDRAVESDVLICSRPPRGHRGDLRDRRARSRTAPARRRRALQRHPHRGVHRGAAAAQRPLQDPGGGEVHRHRRGLTGPPTPPVPPVSLRDVMRLYDTARRAVVPFEPGPIVTMYTCGITPYDATHLGHAAVYVTYDVLQRRLRDLGHDDPLRAQHHRRRRRPAAQGPRARRPLPRPGRRPRSARFDDDMVALNVRRVLERAAGHVGHRRHPRASSAWCSTRATPTRRRRRSTSTSSTFDRLRPDQPLSTRRDARRCARERGGNVDDPNKRDPLDFVLWQPSARRRAVVGVAVGPGPAGLAHRVLGAGPARARHHHRPARRRRRPDLPAPRVRGGPERGRHRPAVRAPLDAPGDGPHGRREDVEVARQPGVRQRPAEDLGPPGHPPRHRRAPLPRLVGVGRRADAAGRRRGSTGGWPRRRSPADRLACSTRSGPALDDDLDTPGAVAAIDAAVGAGRGASATPAALLGVDPRRRLTRPALPDRRPSAPMAAVSDCRACVDGDVRSASSTPPPAAVLDPLFAFAVAHRGRGTRPPARRRAAPSCAPTTRSSTASFLAIVAAAAHHLRGQGRVHGRLEDEVPLPGAGHDPDRPRRRLGGQPGARRRRPRARRRRAVRHLPRGHPLARRQAPQGPHRRGPPGHAHRLPDHPGRPAGHPRGAAARPPLPKPFKVDARALRPADRRSPATRDQRRRSPRAAARSPTS